MKTVSFTDFRKQASGLIDEVEHGERLVIMRHGRPVAEVVPYSDEPKKVPSWKRPHTPLDIPGLNLTAAILDERESGL